MDQTLTTVDIRYVPLLSIMLLSTLCPPFAHIVDSAIGFSIREGDARNRLPIALQADAYPVFFQAFPVPGDIEEDPGDTPRKSQSFGYAVWIWMPHPGLGSGSLSTIRTMLSTNPS